MAARYGSARSTAAARSHGALSGSSNCALRDTFWRRRGLQNGSLRAHWPSKTRGAQARARWSAFVDMLHDSTSTRVDRRVDARARCRMFSPPLHLRIDRRCGDYASLGVWKGPGESYRGDGWGGDAGGTPLVFSNAGSCAGFFYCAHAARAKKFSQVILHTNFRRSINVC